MAFRDLALASRALRKSPIFTLTAAITIALGVGASTAIFSVANAVLLRPLPHKNPNQLVIIPCDFRNRGVKDFTYSNETFIDVRNATKDQLQDIAGVITFPNTFTNDEDIPEQAKVGVVNTNYFSLIGAKFAYGRNFDNDDGLPQPPPPQQRLPHHLSAFRAWPLFPGSIFSTGSAAIPPSLAKLR